MKSSICKYFENCNVAKISGRNCADYENCQTYKYYQRYLGILGIGAMRPDDVSRLEKEANNHE